MKRDDECDETNNNADPWWKEANYLRRRGRGDSVSSTGIPMTAEQGGSKVEDYSICEARRGEAKGSLLDLALAPLAPSAGVSDVGRVLLATVVGGLVSARACLVESAGEAALLVRSLSWSGEVSDIRRRIGVDLVDVGKDTSLGLVASLEALVDVVNEDVGEVVVVVDGGGTDSLALVHAAGGNGRVVGVNLLVSVVADGLTAGGRGCASAGEGLLGVAVAAVGGPAPPPERAVGLVTANPLRDARSVAAPRERGKRLGEPWRALGPLGPLGWSEESTGLEPVGSLDWRGVSGRGSAGSSDNEGSLVEVDHCGDRCRRVGWEDVRVGLE